MTIGIEANRLIQETSPYLLQHAYNPVDWYPWGEKAFHKAKVEDKPIFLSIGYSTCHWCHVMERESFEDNEVATLMNDTFVNIKVDREQRPDIDSVYMSVCQILTGSGGWPLTIIMTPDQKPFYAGTYIPKTSKFKIIGMMELIPRINKLWKENRKSILQSSNEILDLLNNNENKKWESKNTLINNNVYEDEIEDVFKKTYQDLEYSFDHLKGGFGDAPKFPTPHKLLFLLRYWKKTNNPDALDMVNKTLYNMRMGGIFDQIGFGFHRYSTDSDWLLPHFEKMLYDQALMTIVYVEAYQATKEEIYKETAQEMLEYVMRDLIEDNGCFYSAEDADSEGEEGKFYIWTEEEINSTLKEKLEYAKEYFNIKKEGNYYDESIREKTGKNILHLDREDKLFMIDKNKIKEIRKNLFNVRNNRIRPGLDDKILTDWNGIMIAAFSMAGRVFNNKEYINTAKKACDFFMKSIDQNNGLLHSYCKGKWDNTSSLDDYAFLIWGLIELYEVTFEENYLKQAINLTNEAIKLFWDQHGAGFFLTSIKGEKLILRKKEIYDGAIPSGNSIMLSNLLKLSSLVENEKLLNKANKMVKYFINEIKEYPQGYTQMICGLYYAFGDSGEITITGELKETETIEIMKKLWLEYFPNVVIKLNTMDKVDHKPYATLCLNKTCGIPTRNVNYIISQLQ
ncbi:MAG: thioredoxin domain-containing protein [Eubacteriaceae bacterium]